MRTSTDIVNYFKRSAKRKELRKQKRIHIQQIGTLLQELQGKKDWQIMYSELIERLQNVPKYCALKTPNRMETSYPLKRFATSGMAVCIPSKNSVLQYSHAENLYYVEAIIHDFVTEDLIHFEINTSEGVYAYQYSKNGIAIQPFKMILKEITWLLTRAWFDKLHPKKGK